MREHLKLIEHDVLTKFPTRNPYELTKVEKISFQMNPNKVVQDKKQWYPTLWTINNILGQAPLLVKAKRSVASFKLRKGMDIGTVVDLRKNNMLWFYERFHITVLPSVLEKTHRALKKKETSFKQLETGQLQVGIPTLNLFPEIKQMDLQWDSIGGAKLHFYMPTRNGQAVNFYILSAWSLPITWVGQLQG